MAEDYPDQLRRLGFPEKVVEEIIRADELHLFDMEPSSDLIKLTLARCKFKRAHKRVLYELIIVALVVTGLAILVVALLRVL